MRDKNDYSYSSFAFRVGKYQDRKKYEEGYDKINWNMKKFIVYTSPSCKYCNMVKDFLTEKGITFKEIDITKNEEARKMLIKKDFMGLPIVKVDKEFIVGYNINKLKKFI